MTPAFATSAALPALRGASAAKRSVCAIRMEDAAAPVAIAPLNADESAAMKEMYTVAAGKKAAICRCWQSSKHPICDGSHNKFNKETGSHVGPLVVSVETE